MGLIINAGPGTGRRYCHGGHGSLPCYLAGQNDFFAGRRIKNSAKCESVEPSALAALDVSSVTPFVASRLFETVAPEP